MHIGNCVALCCSVLQCVAVCCSVLHCVAMCCNMLQWSSICIEMFMSVYMGRERGSQNECARASRSTRLRRTEWEEKREREGGGRESERAREREQDSSVLKNGVVWCSVVCCCVLQQFASAYAFARWCSVVCCSVLQYVAVSRKCARISQKVDAKKRPNLATSFCAK